MNFADYYNGDFRSDLQNVMASANFAPNHASDPEPALQPLTISQSNPIVRAWSQEREDLFAVALFFTVLVDQACYTYFPSYYKRFREFTLYPKFKGNCPGGCMYHLSPSVILETIGRVPRGSDKPVTRLRSLILEAVPVMEREVVQFCQTYMPELNGMEFWSKCFVYVPFANRG